RGEPFLLPFPCSLPYALQRLCHACPARRPGRALLGSHSPWSRPFAPPAPPQIAPPRSPDSSLLWPRPTSRIRSSSASAPHLSDADLGGTWPSARCGTSQVPTRSLPA